MYVGFQEWDANHSVTTDDKALKEQHQKQLKHARLMKQTALAGLLKILCNIGLSYRSPAVSQTMSVLECLDLPVLDLSTVLHDCLYQLPQSVHFRSDVSRCTQLRIIFLYIQKVLYFKEDCFIVVVIIATFYSFFVLNI